MSYLTVWDTWASSGWLGSAGTRWWAVGPEVLTHLAWPWICPLAAYLAHL